MVFLKVADDGLDGGPPFELALDLRRDAALLAGGVNLELVVGQQRRALAREQRRHGGIEGVKKIMADSGRRFFDLRHEGPDI
jgi:hypothetical protein